MYCICSHFRTRVTAEHSGPCTHLLCCYHRIFFESGMYICSQSGELVHPIHLKHLVEAEEHRVDDGAPVVEDEEDEEEEKGGLERGTPVHSG
jgi:hypothetical protein